MTDTMPPLPAGFTLDQDESEPTQDAVPPLPAGFKMDEATTPSGPPQPMGAFTDRNNQPELLPMLWEGAKETAQSIVHGVGTLADVATGTAPGDGSHAERWASNISTDPTMGGQINIAPEVARAQAVSNAYDKRFGTGPAAAEIKTRIPQALEAISMIDPAIRIGARIGVPVAKGVGRALLPPVVERAPATPLSAEEVLARNAAESQGNMGAAEAPPSLEGVSPELKGAIAKSSGIDSDALQRHIDAETLPQPEGIAPLRLRKGQATEDAQQISDEKNLRADPDTQGILSASITDQDAKLGSSMGEIRRRATPTIVQRSNAEHGQSAVDLIKTQDNAALTDVRAKYKALSDQNGGAMPIDTGSVLTSIKDRLSKGFLTKTAADNPVVSEVLDHLNSGQPMSFETFENARTNLAEVQRGGGSEAKAAGIVRDALENMPLSADAAKLKDLADTARTAARQRFETIEQNPAYEAVVNDNVPKTPAGLHNVGVPSPLADMFMDRYFLGNGASASRAYIARLKGVVKDPEFSQAIEAASLNKLRDASGLDIYDNGAFRNASYRNARNAMDKKADVLMSPQSADWTDQLKRVSGYVNDEGKASTVNRSNTALTLQRFGAQYPETPGLAGTLGEYGTDLAATHFLGPVGAVANNVRRTVMKSAKDRKAIESTRAAKLKFAQDATAPGAGIDTGVPRVTRATGGKVDHEVLLNRLIQRWKAAKKMNDAGTETLLKAPDASIIRALDIAREHTA